MADWSPAHYLKFAGERARPALDLLSRIDGEDAGVAYDLGCGPGNSTALLAARFPRAAITGIDNSPAMLAAARKALPSVRFIEVDLVAWQPPEPADLFFANATLQWVEGHVGLMQRLLAALRPGGALAVQMPDNLDEPSHALMRHVAADARWRQRLASASAAREPILSARGYAEALLPHCRSLEVWRTVYHHPLAGAAAIVEFVSAAGLRPFLAPLGEEEQAAFKSVYEAELRAAYPPLADGSVLLAFPRIFIVARM